MRESMFDEYDIDEDVEYDGIATYSIPCSPDIATRSFINARFSVAEQVSKRIWPKGRTINSYAYDVSERKSIVSRSHSLRGDVKRIIHIKD